MANKGEVKTGTGMGVAVSTLQSDDDPPISDEHKSAFDWCKEGNVDVIERLLKTSEFDIQQLDENVIWCIDVYSKSAGFQVLLLNVAFSHFFRQVRSYSLMILVETFLS